MLPVVALTTDFGLADPYVGVMKGVILSINPNATIVDISHDVRPQDIVEGAFVLSTSFSYFPPGTIHVVIVDPGVGGDRAALLVETSHGFFVGPDNGVLSWATSLGGSEQEAGRKSARIRRLIKLTNSKYWLPRVSTTFHGRDIFAPVAAYLSLGVPPDRFGHEVTDYVQLPWPPLERRPDGCLVGSVLHIDRFGNLITNVPGECIAGSPSQVVVQICGCSISGLSRTYQDSGLLALIGSSGHLEIAVSGGSAAAALGATRGTDVTVCFSGVSAGGPCSAGRA